MTSSYDFRQFQQELAALEGKPAEKPAPKPVGKKALAAERIAKAKADFLKVRDRYELTVAEVVAFFPEEEGIAYLQALIAASESKPRRARKSSPAA